MTDSLDRLYDLLPVVHRQRDAEQGYPLRALLQVIAAQANVVQADIDRLYDNWFIETAEDWVVPYLGDLIGYEPVQEAGEPGDVTTVQGRARNRALIPRRELANTLRYRRRKGTLALLELLAADVAGWPARAVEFYTLLGWLQALNAQRPERGRLVDLRDGQALRQLNGPFDRWAHTVDVRRVASRYTPGRYNIPSVGLFVWRLRAYSVTGTPAYCLEEVAPQCYTFSVLSNDAPLYNRPQPETEPTHIAGPLNLPVPIGRRDLEERLIEAGRPVRSQASEAYYGTAQSLAIWAPDWPKKGAPQPVPREQLLPADLTDWQYRAKRGTIAVDPELGRMVFPPGQLPRQGVFVFYHYGFSADLGGGEYDRTLSELAGRKRYRVRTPERARGRSTAAGSQPERSGEPWYPTIRRALEVWQQERAEWPAAVIEIADSGVYTEQLNIVLLPGESLEIRAANGVRPVLRLIDYLADRPDAFTVTGAARSHLALDGLLITGRSLQILGPEPWERVPGSGEDESEVDEGEYDEEEPGAYDAGKWAGQDYPDQGPDPSRVPPGQVEPAAGDLCAVDIRHCTLVPGWGLNNDCEPRRPSEPSLELINTRARVTIEHSIVGTIRVVADEVGTDPIHLHVTDSIVDATGSDCDSPECEALGTLGGPLAHAVLHIERSTVFGRVETHAIDLAENSIFMGRVTVARRQIGCMRFCYVPSGSRTPRRYNCQPDGAVAAFAAEAGRPATEAERAQVELRVHPQFESVRYGRPGYARLALGCAPEITRGADDESEMGVFHDLYQPQREANLRTRLEEYTPAAMSAGIIFAD